MQTTQEITFALLLAAFRVFRRFVPKEGLILSGVEEDFEYGEARKFSQRLGRRELFETIKSHAYDKADALAEISRAHSLDSLKSLALEYLDFDSCAGLALDTPEELEARRKEDERARLEVAARELAFRRNVKLGSLDFIHACNSELRRFSDYREGLREDGLCIGYGVTPDQWFDEFNSSQGDSASVRDILAWLESECPLLMAQYREAEARGDFDTSEE